MNILETTSKATQTRQSPLRIQYQREYYSNYNAKELRIQTSRLARPIPPEHSKRILSKGFTLIELLTVISVIVILTSLLLPALKRAKDTAADLKCRGNLKQLGYMYSMYAADWDSWCATIYGTGGTCCGGGWHDNSTLLQYLGWQSGMNPYDSSKGPLSVRLCPSDPSPFNGGTIYKILSYGGNECLGAGASFYGNDYFAKRKLSNFKKPSQTAEFCDSTHIIVGPNYHLAGRHNTYLNIIYIDTHVDRRKALSLPLSVWNSFWCGE